jgi:peptide deformylase
MIFGIIQILYKIFNMKIITHPNPILRELSEAVKAEEIKTSKFLEMLKEMGEIMFEKDGIGLAAPQVGILKRVIVINVDGNAVPFINPKIVAKSWHKDTKEEGCLSVPEVFGKVKRHMWVKVNFLDAKGEEHEMKVRGLLARVFQHEIDHLDGVLFIDKIVK